jgi:hypothetical protein
MRAMNGAGIFGIDLISDAMVFIPLHRPSIHGENNMMAADDGLSGGWKFNQS